MVDQDIPLPPLPDPQDEIQAAYDRGVSTERSRGLAIAQAWQRPSFILTQYGQVDDYRLQAIVKAAKLIEDMIASGRQPTV